MNILKIGTKKRELGDFGEREAEKLLRKKGFKIRERNFAAVGHEIDIIAENKEYLVFTEVKTRSADKTNSKEPRPASAVGPDKQRGIISTAKFYSAANGKGKKKRFDVIEVFVTEDSRGKRKVLDIKHLENAFNCDTAYKAVR